MRFVVRYAHLAELPNHQVGDVIAAWEKSIARMGNTGLSTAAHLHLDIVEEKHLKHKVHRLKEIMGMFGNLEDVMLQYHYFIDAGLFGIEPVITTSFGDPGYVFKKKWKFHPAFDLVPSDRHGTEKHFDIHWNRSIPGRVVGVGYHSSYGNYLMIAYGA